MKSETTSGLQLEIGKKYKVRNKSVKYVEIIGVYGGKYAFDFEGTTLYKNGRTFYASYMSNGNYRADGCEDSLDLIEEYKEPIIKSRPSITCEILVESSPGDMEFRVTEMLSEGWQLVGQVNYNDGYFVATLVKEK